MGKGRRKAKPVTTMRPRNMRVHRTAQRTREERAAREFYESVNTIASVTGVPHDALTMLLDALTRQAGDPHRMDLIYAGQGRL